MRRFVKRLFSIPYQSGAKQIEACVTYDGKETTNTTGIILTHGAGGDMNLPQLTLLSDNLADCGYTVFRFTCKGLNLTYRIKVYTEVLSYLMLEHQNIKKWILGGRSMGARAAVGLANSLKGTDVERCLLGVLCLSYPLHTKDGHTNLRDAPLRELTSCAVFISGTKDDMCEHGLMIKTLKTVKNNECIWIENGNHGLKVRGETDNAVVLKIGESINTWCQKLILECETKLVTTENNTHETGLKWKTSRKLHTESLTIAKIKKQKRK